MKTFFRRLAALLLTLPAVVVSAAAFLLALLWGFVVWAWVGEPPEPTAIEEFSSRPLEFVRRVRGT